MERKGLGIALALDNQSHKQWFPWLQGRGHNCMRRIHALQPALATEHFVLQSLPSAVGGFTDQGAKSWPNSVSQDLPWVSVSLDCYRWHLNPIFDLWSFWLSLETWPHLSALTSYQNQRRLFPTHEIDPLSTDKIEFFDSFLCISYYYLFLDIIFCLFFFLNVAHPAPIP